MKLSKRLIASAILISAFCAISLCAEPATQPNLDDAISHLGDPDPAQRERAAKTLRDAGASARKALEAAAAGDDPEIAARAKDLLRTAPSVSASAKVEPDDDLPELTRYRASTGDGKRQVITELAASKDGIRALTKLWVLETDKDLRNAIFEQLVSEPSKAAASLLADGSVATAELLLTAALDRKAPESPQAFAAYALCRGKLDEAIRRWSPRGGLQPADNWAELVLAALYRAKSDAPSAVAHARASDDPDVLQETLLWAGDWVQLSNELHHDRIGPRVVRDMGLVAGASALAGDAKAVDADLAKLVTLIHSDRDAQFVANTMMLIDRPGEAMKTLVDAVQFASAYDLLCDRGLADDAAALVAAHDAEMTQEAMLLRCAAARHFARLGLKTRCAEMIDRIARENATIRFPRVFTMLAEAERAAGMTEQSWAHFLEAIGAVPGRAGMEWYVSRAFPSKQEGVEWTSLWYGSYFTDRRRARPVGELFDRIRRAYDESMPLDELQRVVTGVDISAENNQPYIKLAQECAMRMKKAGQEAEAAKFLEDLAPRTAKGELYIRLGDWAAEKNDWALAAKRYSMAWRGDRTAALPLYLQGWALERGGQVAEGRDRMELAHLLPLGDEASRAELINGLLAHGLDDAAAREESVLIRTGHPLSGSSENALRSAAEYADDHGDFAVAAGLWQRSLVDFLSGTYAFRFQTGYLHLADAVRRSQARAMLAAGDLEGMQRAIKASFDLMPGDSAIAIDLVPDLDKLGKHAEADALFAKAFAIQQAICDHYNHSAYHFNEYAWLAAKCHRELDKALEHAKLAVQWEPKNAAAIDTLAEVHYQRGDFAEAVALEKKCVDLSPEFQIHRRQLAKFEAALQKK